MADDASHNPASEITAHPAARGPGRPAVLDDEKKQRICTLITAGCNRAEAARYVGCAHNTIKHTARRDAAFATQLTQAEVGRQLNELDKVRRASGKSWRAAAWLLKHYNPDRFTPARRDLYTREQILQIVRSVGKELVSSSTDIHVLLGTTDRVEAVLEELSTRAGIRRRLKSE